MLHIDLTDSPFSQQPVMIKKSPINKNENEHMKLRLYYHLLSKQRKCRITVNANRLQQLRTKMETLGRHKAAEKK